MISRTANLSLKRQFYNEEQFSHTINGIQRQASALAHVFLERTRALAHVFLARTHLQGRVGARVWKLLIANETNLHLTYMKYWTEIYENLWFSKIVFHSLY